MNPDKLAENKEGEEEEYVPAEVDEGEESNDDLEYDSEYESDESSIDLEEAMGVTVRTVMGQEFNFMVTLDTTVIDLKMAIFVNLNRMHPDTQVENLLVLTLIMLTLADHMLTLALIMLVLNADADHGDVGADLPGRGDGGGRGDYGRLRHPGGEKLHVLKLCPPKSWSRTKSSKCKKKTFAGRFDHPAPAQAGQWLHHPSQQVFIVIYFSLLKTKMCSA